MRTVKLFVAPALVVALVLGLASLRADDDSPKLSIKEVMKQAHGQISLANKVIAGKGTKEDKEKLVELYTALAANKPTQGDQELWKEKTTAMVDAAKAVEEGKEGATKDLKKAVDCASCHKVFKPKK